MDKSQTTHPVAVPGSDDRYYKDASDWETSRNVMVARSERRAWLVAIVAVGAAILALGTIAALLPLKQRIPYLIYVDKFSGDAQVREVAVAKTIGYSEILNKHWASVYVTSRERYYYNLLQSDYNLTMALSAPQVAARYNRQFDGSGAIQKRLGRTQEYAVRVISITLTSRGENQSNVAVVRFEKTLRSSDGTQPETTERYVATMSFIYHLSDKMSEEQLMENPLGFTVTSYQVDPELVDTLPSTPNSNTGGVSSPAGRIAGADGTIQRNGAAAPNAGAGGGVAR